MASGVESLCYSNQCSCAPEKKQGGVAVEADMTRSQTDDCTTKVADSLNFAAVFHLAGGRSTRLLYCTSQSVAF